MVGTVFVSERPELYKLEYGDRTVGRDSDIVTVEIRSSFASDSPAPEVTVRLRGDSGDVSLLQ